MKVVKPKSCHGYASQVSRREVHCTHWIGLILVEVTPTEKRCTFRSWQINLTWSSLHLLSLSLNVCTYSHMHAGEEGKCFVFIASSKITFNFCTK